MNLRKCMLFLTALLLLSNALIAIPRTIAYQGILTGASGTPVKDGKYSVEFLLFETESGGTTAFWSEKHDSVATIQGGFSVVLGKKSLFSAAFDKQYFLEMKVNGVAIAPRIPLTAAAYALRADTAKVAKSVPSLDAVLAGKATAVHGHSGLTKKGKSDTAMVADTVGLIGIGTTSPATFLHLKYAAGTYAAEGTSGFINEAISGRGTQRIRSVTNNPTDLLFDVNGAARWDISTRASGDGYRLDFYGQSTTTPAFNSVSGPYLTLLQNGNVGIGTSEPTTLFEVYNMLLLGNQDAKYPAMFVMASPDTFPTSDGSNETWSAGGAYWASPMIYRSKRSPNDGSGSFPFNQFGELILQGTTHGTGYNRGISFVTSPGNGDPSICMRIKENGNVGIGTTNPGSKLVVAGDISATGTITPSDRRLKKDVLTIENALSLIAEMRGVRFNWDQKGHPDRNFSDKRQIGLIAQEVESVLPELVHTDADGFKSVAYDKLTAVLIEAVNKLKQQNDSLHMRVARQNEAISEVFKRVEALEMK